MEARSGRGSCRRTHRSRIRRPRRRDAAFRALRRGERHAAAERPADHADPARVDASGGSQSRGRIPGCPHPDGKRITPSPAGATAEASASRRWRRPEVVDVKRRDTVVRQLADEAVVEGRKPATAVQDDNCTTAGGARPAELRMHDRPAAREIGSRALGAEARKRAGERGWRDCGNREQCHAATGPKPHADEGSDDPPSAGAQDRNEAGPAAPEASDDQEANPPPSRQAGPIRSARDRGRSSALRPTAHRGARLAGLSGDSGEPHSSSVSAAR